MGIKIASWNTEGRLGRIANKGRGAPEHIVEEILGINADVVFLADAYNRPVDSAVDDLLSRAGYVWFDVAYKDEGVQANHRQPYSRMLTKCDVIEHAAVRYGDVRTLQSITVQDPATNKPIRCIGVHLDDRSDALRHRQVDALLAELDQCSEPVVLLGDFNADHHDRLLARVLNHKMTQSIFEIVPMPLVRSLGKRLGEMCSGEIMQRIAARADMREVDHLHRPTMTLKTLGLLYLPALPVIQLDHMYISKHLRHTGIIIEKDGGSDHRAISTIVHKRKR